MQANTAYARYGKGQCSEDIARLDQHAGSIGKSEFNSNVMVVRREEGREADCFERHRVIRAAL